MTLIIAIAYLTLISLKFVEFFGETDQIEYMSVTGQGMDEVIDLTRLKFSFAIEALEERFGTLQV